MQSHGALRERRLEEPVTESSQVRTDASVLAFPALEISASRMEPAAAGALVHKDLHPGVYKVAVGAWAIFIGIFWLAFWVSANALFMVAISTVYAVMFFGVPFVLSRLAPDASVSEHGLIQFLRGKVDTLYGPVSSLEALVQVILVPVALSLGGVAMALIIQAARTVH